MGLILRTKSHLHYYKIIKNVGASSSVVGVRVRLLNQTCAVQEARGSTCQVPTF